MVVDIEPLLLRTMFSDMSLLSPEQAAVFVVSARTVIGKSIQHLSTDFGFVEGRIRRV
jgi:hypothetical protein